MSLFNNRLPQHSPKKTGEDGRKKRAIVRYFEALYAKFPKIVLLNFVYFLCILPLLCGAITFTSAALNLSEDVIQSFFFIHTACWVTSWIPRFIFIPLFIISFACYGPLTAGLTYCMRNLANGSQAWVSDMFTRSWSNLKQGLAFGILDAVVAVSFIFYISADFSSQQGGALIFYRTLKVVALCAAVIYMTMRFYTYTIAVTFELPIKDILKNSLIFCVLGFFRNLLMFLIIAIVVISFISTPRVDVVLIATLFFSICRFSALFTTYPVIDEYMLKSKEKTEQKTAE